MKEKRKSLSTSILSHGISSALSGSHHITTAATKVTATFSMTLTAIGNSSKFTTYPPPLPPVAPACGRVRAQPQLLPSSALSTAPWASKVSKKREKGEEDTRDDKDVCVSSLILFTIYVCIFCHLFYLFIYLFPLSV